MRGRCSIEGKLEIIERLPVPSVAIELPLSSGDTVEVKVVAQPWKRQLVRRVASKCVSAKTENH